MKEVEQEIGTVLTSKFLVLLFLLCLICQKPLLQQLKKLFQLIELFDNHTNIVVS